MTWNDFAHNEKKAILKSAMILAQAKGRINDSQSIYLNSLLIRMNEPQSIIGEANSMWKFTMRHVLKSMNSEKKEIVIAIWYDMASRSFGGETFSAAKSFTYFPELLPVVKELASDCNIDITIYI
jgi:hypothetical protein